MILRPSARLTAITSLAFSLLAACGGEVTQGETSGGGTTMTTGDGGSAGAGASGGAAGAAGAPAGGGGAGGATHTGCQSNGDCAMDPKGSICDTTTGACVSCIPTADPTLDCGIGAWCSPAGECKAGCTAIEDCPGGDLICDLGTHACVGCVTDDTCPAGSICVGDQCIPGCSGTHPCQPGYSCCGEQCYDLTADEDNCGSCNMACPLLPHSDVVCKNGQCLKGVCSGGFADCNGDAADGCETNTLIDGPCLCVPGSVQPCYLGAPGTESEGPCKPGSQVCAPSGLGWGSCTGQVLPKPEVCGNGVDENCDGIIDNNGDNDKDGWTACDGDCDDANPLINPGAFEVTYTLVDDDNNPMTPPKVVPGGNGIDDDCDPTTSDTVESSACGPAGAKITGVTATDVANAMDLCQIAPLNPPKSQKKWGLVSAEFTLGSGAPPGPQLATMQNNMAAIMTQYGTINGQPNNPPKKGLTMAGISSGVMRYTGQLDYVVPQSGSSFFTGSCPASYLAAHGNTLPSSQGCSGNCFGGSNCNDSISVKLQVRVPTNAKSMSYDFRFFSAEYPDFLCSTYNDFYLALLTSGAQGIPADKNVSFDGLGNAVSVNNGFFDVCQAAGCFACATGASGLAGTGMDNGIGGGTSWLTTDAPVVPGETITLELMVFDVGDAILDSLALLDNFRWGLNKTSVGTHK